MCLLNIVGDRMKVENRTIFENDNLHVLRGLDTDSIDLIYLDPPSIPAEPLRHP